MQFLIGVIFGIVVSVVGFSGMAKILDKAVVPIKETAIKASQDN